MQKKEAKTFIRQDDLYNFPYHYLPLMKKIVIQYLYC